MEGALKQELEEWKRMSLLVGSGETMRSIFERRKYSLKDQNGDELKDYLVDRVYKTKPKAGSLDERSLSKIAAAGIYSACTQAVDEIYQCDSADTSQLLISSLEKIVVQLKKSLDNSEQEEVLNSANNMYDQPVIEGI
jgi:hypothetical protein